MLSLFGDNMVFFIFSLGCLIIGFFLLSQSKIDVYAIIAFLWFVIAALNLSTANRYILLEKINERFDEMELECKP